MRVSNSILLPATSLNQSRLVASKVCLRGHRVRLHERDKYFQERAGVVGHERVSHARDDVQFRAGNLRRDYLGVLRRDQHVQCACHDQCRRLDLRQPVERLQRVSRFELALERKRRRRMPEDARDRGLEQIAMLRDVFWRMP